MTQNTNQFSAKLSRDCAEVQNELSSYLDDDLLRGEATRVEQHFTVCEPCRQELALLQAALLALALAPRPAPPPAIRNRLLAQVTAETVIERVVTIRQFRDASAGKMQYSVRATRTARLRTSVERAGETASDRSERITIHRSEPMPRILTIYRRTFHR